MQRQRVVRFCQDTYEVFFCQRAQVDADWQTPLKFGQQVRWFRDMECARGNEQYMVGFDRTVFRADRCAFDQRQQVALNAFAADIAATGFLPRSHLVDLVKEHDAVLFNRLKRQGLTCSSSSSLSASSAINVS